MVEQAHTKLLRKTPPSWLGLVGGRLDERTLPLSQRLENFRSVTSFRFFESTGFSSLIPSSLDSCDTPIYEP